MPEHRFEGLRWPAERPVVDIDELVVRGGERLVLFGPNGSGKTTALRLMAGTIGGRRPDGIVYLPQRPYLFRGTARSNLELGLDDSERGRAVQLADEFGVSDRLDGAAGSLSGGERMRIALARTLASDADIVLLDEPLAPLDHRDREQTAAAIAGAPRTVGCHRQPRPFIGCRPRRLFGRSGRWSDPTAGTDCPGVHDADRRRCCRSCRSFERSIRSGGQRRRSAC